MIYTKSYLKVKMLIKAHEYNYEKIMSWRISLFELENNFIEWTKNINSKKYFEDMVLKIKEITY
jgi:hypothetical protein